MATRILGPTGSPLRRRFLFVPLLGVALIFAVFFVGSSGAVNNSPSGFESGDGNMTLQTVTNPATAADWNCFANQTGFSGVGQPASGCAVTSGATQTWADGGTTSVGSSEFQFKSGTKFDDPCVTINVGNNPPKDEWSNIAEYTESAANNDLYFYGASIRPVTTGNSSGNVYFSQKTNGCHTVGDILLAFNFLNGGGTPSLHALEWLASGSNLPCYQNSSTPPCWGNDQAINGSYFDGNVNTGTIQAGANGISGTQLPANAFAEFGINLTQAIKAAGGGSLPCFANQTWVSRSSGSSFSSNPEDVEVVNRPTCGTITVIKHTLDGAGNRTHGNPPVGVDKSFSYTAGGGLSPSSFSLNDKDGTDTVNGNPDPNNTISYTLVPAGSYTVTETLDANGIPAPNFAFNSLSCTTAGNGTSYTKGGTFNQTANITLGFGGNVVCTYTNQQQLGAIRINKTSSKAAATPLSGAKFYLCTNSDASTSKCTAPTPIGGSAVSNPLTTDTNGTICVANLPFATYYVFESAAPGGYAIDDSTVKSAAVNTYGDCSSSTSASVTKNFTDTPLTDLSVHVASEVSGGTKSAVFCKDSSNNNIGNSPQPTGAVAGTTSTYGDPLTLNADPTHGAALTPGTYTCTVYIDP